MTTPEPEISQPARSVRERRYPRLLWLVVLLQGLLMLCTMVLYPAFQNADEGAHTDYVVAHRHGEWLDAPGTRKYQSGVLAATQLVPGTQFAQHVGGKSPLARSARPSIDSLGTGKSTSLITNQMTQHPPLYYGLAAGFSYLLPHFDRQRFDVQVAWLRLFSLLLLLPVPVLIFATTRRVTGSQNIALLACLLPLSIPTYLRTGASVTNDSLMVLVTVAGAALLAKITFGDLSRRTAVLLGLAWAAALLTKGFALSLPPVIVFSYLVGARGSLRRRTGQVWQPVLISGAIGTVLGGWWWARNLIEYGTVQPDGLGPLSDQVRQQVFGRDRSGATELNFFTNFVKLLAQRAWGTLGLLDVPSLPHPLLYLLALAMLLILLAALVAGLGPLRNRSELLTGLDWRISRPISLLLPLVLTVALMYFGARPRYLHGRQLAGDQMRYLLPPMLGMLVCFGVVACWLAGRYQRLLPAVLLSGMLAFVAVSAYKVLDVEMSGGGTSRRDRLSQALHFVVGWSPAPTALTALLGAVTGLVALACLLAFWRDALAQPATGAPAGSRSREPIVGLPAS